MTDLIDEIRENLPGTASKADGGNVLAAVKLFCLECMGGSRNSVVDCKSTKCPLHDYRLGKNPHRKKTKKTPEQKEAAAARLKKAREK